MSGSEVFVLVAVGVWTIVFVQGWRGIARTPLPYPQPEYKGEVCAYMPARDEAGIIQASVQAMLSNPQVTSLVVVDDRSTDGTAERLAELRHSQPKLQTLMGVEPAQGLCGKPAALSRAYELRKPTTSWLLFVDADVVLEPGAVGALLREAEDHRADLVTLIPQVTLGTTLERIVMPSVGALILAHHPPVKVNDPDNSKAFANGQVILIRKETYEMIGGHGAVIKDVLEDVALARKAKAAGARLRMVDGRFLASTRMYESVSELAEGWIKNLFLLMDARWSTALVWAGISLVFGSMAWLCLLVDHGRVGVLGWSAIVVMQGTLRFEGGADPRYAIAAPLGALGASGLLLTSAFKHTWGGGVRWKGRSYRRTDR